MIFLQGRFIRGTTLFVTHSCSSFFFKTKSADFYGFASGNALRTQLWGGFTFRLLFPFNAFHFIVYLIKNLFVKFYLSFTLCPPNSRRSAATSRAANVLEISLFSFESIRNCNDSLITWAGAFSFSAS